MLKKKWKAFSWTEVAIALVIFAVIVGLTLPSFPIYKCLAKQSEAKFELMRILAAAQLYKAQKGSYPTLSELTQSQRVRLHPGNYTYEVKSTDEGLLVVASGKKGSVVETDMWQVDTDRNLEHVVDACAQ